MIAAGFRWSTPPREDSMRPYVIASVAGHLLLTVVVAWLSHLLVEPPPALQLLRVDLAMLELPAETVVATPVQPPVEEPEPVVEEQVAPRPEPKKPVPEPPAEVRTKVPDVVAEVREAEVAPDPSLVQEPSEPALELPPKPRPVPQPAIEESVDFLEPDEVQTAPSPVTEKAMAPTPAVVTPEEEVAEGATVQATATEGIEDSFLMLVQTKIGRRWRPTPASTRGQSGVKAIVRFRIGPQGQVISPTVVESSGLTVFDRQALVAVERSAPLPSPPSRFGDEGVEIDFHFRYTR